MTYERAKTRLEHNESFDKALSGDLDAIELAIEAIEKQIPKKLAKSHGTTCCPTCRTIKTGSSPYCRYCGQAIDWSNGANE